jgi:hypothetical protein
MCASGLRTRFRKWEKAIRRNGISLRALTPSHHTVTIPSALAESVQTTVYATMQPAKMPPPMSASMGVEAVEGSSSSRGALDVMANTGSDAKKSIVMSVVSVV